MSEVTLAESDARTRWVGVSPHRVVLALFALGVLGWWTLAPAAPIVLLVVALLLGALGFPCVDDLSVGEYVGYLARFLMRSHWSHVTLLDLNGDLALWASGEVSFRGYELLHRGRLDLSGRDRVVAEELATVLDSLAASSASRHVSVHVVARAHRATLLTLPTSVGPPPGWRLDGGLVAAAIGLDQGRGELALLERVTYLRARSGVARVFRVRDFSSASSGALLERWARSCAHGELSVHYDVVSGTRAHRLAARAVHRAASDEVASRGAGFRRSARSARADERLEERERLVARGRVLIRLAVYAVVWAPSLDELDRVAGDLRRGAHDAGLRLERGAARQAAWFRAQLPGGPGW